MPQASRIRKAELTLRMLGDNITLEGHQWQELLDELRPDSELHERITKMLNNSVVIKTADGFTATEDWAKSSINGGALFNYYDMQYGHIAWSTVKENGGDLWFTFVHREGGTSILNGERICTLAHARRVGWVL